MSRQYAGADRLDSNELWILRQIYRGETDLKKLKKELLLSDKLLSDYISRIQHVFGTSKLKQAASKAKEAGII